MAEEKNTLSNKIKSIATLLTAIGALVTALGSYLKPTDTKATRVSYDVLSGELEKINEENRKQHDMIIGLKGALDQMTRSQAYSYSPPQKISYDAPNLLPPSVLFSRSNVKVTPKVPNIEQKTHTYSPKSFDEIVK